MLALDPAASEFFEEGKYILRKSDGSQRTPAEMVAYWEEWVRQYPILSIEDGVAENDDAGWRLMTDRLGGCIQLVGDDNLVTNPALIRKALADGIANAVRIKLNQIGTLTETFAAIKEAQRAAWSIALRAMSASTNARCAS